MTGSAQVRARAIVALVFVAVLVPAGSLGQFSSGVPGQAYRPAPMKPDLVVTGLAIMNFGVSMKTPCAPGRPRFDLGPCGNPQFLVTVTNNGSAFANGATALMVSVNGSWALGATFVLDQLAPGASVEVNAAVRLAPCDLDCGGASKAYRFGARVDGTNRIEESDEGNNLWTGADLVACRHCP